MITLDVSRLSRMFTRFAAAMLMVSAGSAAAASALPSGGVPEGTVLHFADQAQAVQTVMAASGETKRSPFQVEYANFVGGPAILEAFRAGALDIGTVGNTPPIQAQAAGVPLLIVAARSTSSPDYLFAVRPGLKINQLSDLAGKKIAYAEGTGRQPYVLMALALAGLSSKDVTLVALRAGDFPDAVRFGQVDVAPLTEAQFARYGAQSTTPESAGFPTELYQHLPRGLQYLYASQSALEDPAKSAAIAVFVRQWIAATQWSADHPQQWARDYYVKTQGISEADGLAIIRAQGQFDYPALSSLIPAQQNTIDMIHEAGDIPNELDAAKEFDLRFDPIIQAALSAPASEAPHD